MTFLLDHCIWRETENILQEANFTCITLRKLGKSEAANGEVIAITKAQKAILLTRDRDFSNFSLYPPRSHEGIVLLRITPKSMDNVHKVLLEALKTISAEQHLKGNLLVVTSTAYRLHRHK